jgi:hypothetical protein
LFSNTLSFLSTRNVCDQVSHPYKTTGKIIAIYYYYYYYCITSNIMLNYNRQDKKLYVISQLYNDNCS